MLVRISKCQNIFAKSYVPNWSQEVFVINKVKNTVPWTYIISNLNEEEIIGTFYEKELQKTNQNEFRVEKEIQRKDDKTMLNGKAMILSKTKIFSKTKILRRKSVSRIRFINYATKTDLKNATGVYTSQFTKKVDIASLKSRVDKLGNDQL